MRPIWAVARNLIIEVLRMRALVIFSAFVLGLCTVGLAFWLHTTQGRADQETQTFLSYSLSFTWHYLAFFTIFTSIATITRDIKRKEIYTVATKPISRGGVLLGKFLGMALLNLVLLALVGAVIYGAARTLQRTEPTTQDERRRMAELVFTARRAIVPPLPDVEEQVLQKVEQDMKLEREREPDMDARAVRNMRFALEHDYTKQFILRQRSVPPGQHIVWHFAGVKPAQPDSDLVFIRYKHDVSRTPGDLAVTSQWAFGPDPDVIHTGTRLDTRDVIRTVHEFAIPASVVSAQGDLYVAYRNPVVNAPITVIFPAQGRNEIGIEVLYAASTFEYNFLRALLAMYLRLVFLALLGTALGAWLSFPVAVLVLMIVFVFGLSSNFILDAVKWSAGGALQAFAKGILFVLPEFAAYDPVPDIEKGRIVSGRLLFNASFFMLGIKGALAALFGYAVFRIRELARVIV